MLAFRLLRDTELQVLSRALVVCLGYGLEDSSSEAQRGQI